ncbi:putative receptor-like protein kinase At5g59700 [Apium graveolens]|uniref:putative receptor-like protein kinase At5g59700 n=1 Tax=Apium graveolens TaxID=4045 RepID=UPI003D7AD4AE
MGMLPIWILFIMCLICSSLQFNPVDNYLIDCGSSKNTSIGTRVFMADNSSLVTLLTLQTLFVNTTSKPISSTTDLALYQTARVFGGISNYTFPIKKQGGHFIRLYFYPFNHESRNLSTARFSVSAQSFTLLRDFQPPRVPVVKEYVLNITSDSLVLNFIPYKDSFAFLNALEVISIPDGLIPDSAKTFNPSGEQNNLWKHALEKVARVNMGKLVVNPENDSLWRHWDSDFSYLKHGNLVRFVDNITSVNYTGFPTKDIAPASVYGTATKLDTDSDPNTFTNMTWSFDVDPGFSYFVRFHFCDIVSLEPKNMFFNVYIYSLSVVRDLDLSKQTSNMLRSPYYIDFISRSRNNRNLSISIGPSEAYNAYPNGILNGIEIMKISDSQGNLDLGETREQSSTSNSIIKSWMILGSAIVVTFVAVVLALVFFMIWRRRKLAHLNNSTQDKFGNKGRKSTDGTVTISSSNFGYSFPLAVIKEATENFNDALIIGIGGFGKVYKGVLRDETKVAVKRGVPESQQGFAEFETEIEMLSQFRHRHLVSLIGYCDEQNEMIIIYEYMDNGTLKNHLYGSDLPKLNWRQRLEICIGSAKGLHYLHTGSTKAIIHRDVKSANILLDENLMAKVADFGLSKNGPEMDHTHVSTAVKGSFGYLDPEYLIRQQLTEKSDVYSFGVVMLEILSGRAVIDPSQPRETVNLVEWAGKWLSQGKLEKLVDPYLAEEIKPESLENYGEIAEKCLAERGVDRPTMGEILWKLECALQLQGISVRPRLNNQPSNSHFEDSVLSMQYSVGSDIDGVSMSKVFSDMVKTEMR